MVEYRLSPLGSTLGLSQTSETGSPKFKWRFLPLTICVTLEKLLNVFITQLSHPSKGIGNNYFTGFLYTLTEKLSDILKYLQVSGLSSSF